MNLSEQETRNKIKLYQTSRFRRIKKFSEKLCEDMLLNRLLLKEIEKLEKEEIKKEFHKKFLNIKKLLLKLQKNSLFSEDKELNGKFKEVEHNLEIIENDMDNYRSYLGLMHNTEQKIIFVYQKVRKRI